MDVLVLLTHGGVESDRSLAEEYPGIDLIVGGHSQTFLREPLRVKNLKTEKRTWIVQAGQNGQYVGKVLVRWEKGKGINLEKYEMIPLTEDIEDDPQIAGLLP